MGMVIIKERSSPELNGTLELFQLSLPLMMRVSPISFTAERRQAEAAIKIAAVFGYNGRFICEHPCHCGHHPEPWEHDAGEVQLICAPDTWPTESTA
jgi:hypothetical protein